MNVVVMMAGSSKKFVKNGQEYPKLLTEVNEKTMLEVVLDGIKSLTTTKNNIVFMVDKSENEKYYLGDVIKLVLPQAHIVIVNRETAGAAVTSLLAIDCIKEDMPLTLINGDQLLDGDEI